MSETDEQDQAQAELLEPCVPYCQRETQPHHGACLQANPPVRSTPKSGFEEGAVNR